MLMFSVTVDHMYIHVKLLYVMIWRSICSTYELMMFKWFGDGQEVISHKH